MQLDRKGVAKFRDGYSWEGVEELVYKQDGEVSFKDISRQILHRDSSLSCELRFFDIKPGGYSTFERHEHVHAVMILHGAGKCLVGDEVRDVGAYDLVTVPSMTWHQFRAAADRPMGFLCMVNVDRDRPQVPTEKELEELRANPEIAAFLDWSGQALNPSAELSGKVFS
ncbi:MAG: cupin domain-containing protein [Rhodobacter sp.]|nr:cupin domain-containing protein [Rhodobacter sp.]